ncbi:hypothetical protein EMIT0P2_50265 [Pseudomonas sp. IT-P2]
MGSRKGDRLDNIPPYGRLSPAFAGLFI